MGNRRLCALAAMALATVPGAAQAQIFWQPADYSGPVATGLDPTLGVALPGATPEEQRAAITWNVRSALNVAALQCNFAPTARTLESYNGILRNHSAELAGAFNTLTNYFKRTSKTPQAGQKALDTYGTRTYSSFSAVAAMMDFCHVSARVSRAALFAPRGSFGTLAMERIRELRNGMIVKGEQQFRRPAPIAVVVPDLSAKCWKKQKYVCS